MLTQRSAHPRLQLDQLKVAAQQFQTAVASELLVTELEKQLLLDRPPPPPYLQPPLWGLCVVPCCVTAPHAPQMTRQRPLFFDQIDESSRIIFGLRLAKTGAALRSPWAPASDRYNRSGFPVALHQFLRQRLANPVASRLSKVVFFGSISQIQDFIFYSLRPFIQPVNQMVFSRAKS
jgi:hypothetical protein